VSNAERCNDVFFLLQVLYLLLNLLPVSAPRPNSGCYFCELAYIQKILASAKI
jgi:hypothetical protein